MATPEYWLISVPNGDKSSSATWDEFKLNLSSPQHKLTEIFQFDVPQLRIGTLDKLMASSDVLAKIDSTIEGVIRKIERTFDEVNGSKQDRLTVENQPVIDFVEKFRWNSAKYPNQRPTDEIAKMLQQNIIKIDEELKEATSAFQDKKLHMSQLQRKKGGNLLVTDLNDVLTPDQFLDTEYIMTVPVVVHKGAESEFLATYESLASDAVGYGPADDRESIRGSPVVPRSAKRIMEDKDDYCLYLVLILKSFEQQFRQEANRRRFMVRTYDSTVSEEDTTTHQLSKVQNQYSEASNQLLQWCSTHYGEAMIAWLHTKAIRLFVESVLRYGLPVNNLSVLVKPNPKCEKEARDRLFKMYSSLDGGGMLSSQKEEANVLGNDQLYPYVNFNVKPLV